MLYSNSPRMGLLDENMEKSLYNKYPRVPVFYTLPIIHKSAPFSPGRPIVSRYGSALEPLAQFLDSFLQPFLSKTGSYVKDTRDFISQMENMPVPSGSVLVTIDINALYTNVPHDEARLVVEESLDFRSLKEPPTYLLIEFLDLILEHNYFRFDDCLNLQHSHGQPGSSIHCQSVYNLF